jgi:putative ABC transport system substrate-binding protein
VAAVKSRNLRIYSDVLTGFSIEARARVVEYDMAGDLKRGKTIFQRIRSRRPTLILAIGTEAATLAVREITDIPILFCMVPNPEKYDFSASNVTGISLNLPIKTQLATLQTIAPRTRNVGVMYNPKYSHSLIEEAFQACNQLGMALIPSKVDRPEDVPRGTRAFLGRVDALWMIADPTLMNSRAFRSLVDFTRKNKVPLFSISEKMVQAGALVSLAADPSSIGRQAGAMANKILRQRVSPEMIPVESPRGLEISINLATAKGIGVECDIALEVFTFAARNGYKISVHE